MTRLDSPPEDGRAIKITWKHSDGNTTSSIVTGYPHDLRLLETEGKTILCWETLT